MSFDAAQRIPDHRCDPKLSKMTVQYQVARDTVTPPQLQAAERVKAKKHKTIGTGNVYAGGNGNVPKRFRIESPPPAVDGPQS